jgi:hypothetical protein
MESVGTFVDVDLLKHPLDCAFAFIVDGQCVIHPASDLRRKVQTLAIKDESAIPDAFPHGASQIPNIFEKISV